MANPENPTHEPRLAFLAVLAAILVYNEREIERLLETYPTA